MVVSLAVGVGACTPFGVPGGDAGMDAAVATEGGPGGAMGTGGADAGPDLAVVDAPADGSSLADGAGTPGDGPSIDKGDGPLDATSCVPSTTPLRLIAPLSTSFVTSRRPTLTWEGQASCGATIDLCSDPLCAQVVATVAPGPGATTGRPSADLPTGVVFWRARSGTAATGAWSFFVGKGTTVDSSGGTFSDFNGDGRSDVAVLADNNVVLVYYGAATGLQSTPTTLSIPSTDVVGSIASVGDVSGDGLADLVVASRSTSTDSHIHLYVFLGNRAGLSEAPSKTIAVQTFLGPGSVASPIVHGGMDINGDGYGDLLVLWGSPTATPVYGGSTDFLQGKDISLDQVLVGSGVIAACDVDGDGLQDLVVLVLPVEGSGPTVAVYRGDGSTFVSDSVMIPSHGVDNEVFDTLACADLQGDGYPEIILGASHSNVRGPGYGDVLAFANVLGTISTTGQSVAGLKENDQAYAGSRLQMIGDMNADGSDDFAIGLGGEQDTVQVEFKAFSASSAATIEIGGIPDTDGEFGAAFAGGDFDGDGLADLIVSSPTHGGGRLTLFRGSQSARLLSPSAIHIDAPVGTTGLGRFLSESR